MKRALLILLATFSMAFAGLGQSDRPDKHGCDTERPELCSVVQGPTVNVPAGWKLIGAADFNRDGYPDYLLYNETTGETFVWFMRPVH